jgi:endonuclease YncB( thermonuclease family)
MIRVLMLCLILLWSGLAGADAIRVESVVSVHDGDTFSADIAGWPAIVGRRIGVRVAGIDAPELHGECPCEVALAKDARAFVTYMLHNADTIELRNVRRDREKIDNYMHGVTISMRCPRTTVIWQAE